MLLLSRFSRVWLCVTHGSPPGSSISGILQARTLEWVAISFSNAWKWSCLVVSNSLQPHGLQPTRLLYPWDFPGKSTGVGCHCLLWITLISTYKKKLEEITLMVALLIIIIIILLLLIFKLHENGLIYYLVIDLSFA